MAAEQLKRVDIRHIRDLEHWLEHHHAQRESVWLVYFKKGSPDAVPYGDIVDTVLAFGWIDSLPRKLDDSRTMLLLSPRKPNSAWSKINKDRVARLADESRMRAPGLRAIALAKENGAWDRLTEIDDLSVPPDLAAALAAVPLAEARFHAFPRSARRGILEWILQAKRPETRARRIEETARLAAQNIRANQPRR